MAEPSDSTPDSNANNTSAPANDSANPNEQPPLAPEATESTGDIFVAADGHLQRTHGMHWITTGVFLTGQLAGAGVITLPQAARRLGFYYGIAAGLVLLLMCAYTSILLGRCWMILIRRWPVYHKHCTNPYAEIGYRALGPWVKRSVEVILNYGMFAVGCVLIVLVSKGVNDVIRAFFSYDFSYCYIVLIVSALILPSFYLRSPENFSWIINLGMVCTVVAILLVMAGISRDASICDWGIEPSEVHVFKVFSGFGSLFFACGGHAVFPSIQHDMRRPHLFARSSNIAFTLVGVMYLPLMVLANYVYGSNIQVSIINNVHTVWIQQAVNILILLHCAMTVVLVMNPINQQVESWGKAPQEFSWKRVLYRTLVLVAAVLVAETFPNFGPLMSLMGGTTSTMTSFLFPVPFYLFLNAVDQKLQERQEAKGEAPAQSTEMSSTREAADEELVKVGFGEVLQSTSKFDLVCCTLIFITAAFVLVAATASAIEELAHSEFVVPCYLSMIWPWKKAKGPVTALTCCGVYHNISVNDGQCNANLVI